MKFEKICTVSCCDFTHTAPYQNQVLEKLMGHIKRKHPEIVKRLNRHGREQAIRNNGCGYFDDLKSNNSDWHKADSYYREAWRMNALKNILHCSDY